MNDQLRKCTQCGIEKSTDEFYARKRDVSTKCIQCEKEYRIANKEKHRAYTKQHYIDNMSSYKEKASIWKKNNISKHRDSNLRANYGITIDDYNLIFDDQYGCCAICGTHQSELYQTLNVDHCHGNRDIPGLLCGKCNKGIGLFNDSIVLLDNAIDYLREV